VRLVQSVDWWTIAVPLTVALGAIAVLLLDLAAPRLARRVVPGASIVIVLGAAGLVAAQWGEQHSTFCVDVSGGVACSYAVDSITTALSAIALGGAVLVLLLPGGRESESKLVGEYHFLLLASLAGAVTLAGARDLITVVIALEVLSLPAFAMVALPAGYLPSQRRAAAAEGALKAFLVSVVALAVMVVGVAMLYGATGSIHLSRISAAVVAGDVVEPVGATGSFLVLAGLLFKVAAVPFHGWVPDTYVGAPERVATYLSVVSKVGGFAGLFVVLWFGLRPYGSTWGPVLAVIAALTMTVGNVAALRERHAVRLLAWSSIGQSGFVLAPLAAAGVSAHALGVALDGAAASLAYLAVYVAMSGGAFAVVTAVVQSLDGGSNRDVVVDGEAPGRLIADYRGLARTEPATAWSLAFFLICLAGLPPAVAGLVVKVVVLRSTVDAGMGWLAVVMAVNVVLGLAYYLRFAAILFLPSEARGASAGRPDIRVPLAPALGIGLALGATVVLSMWPQTVLQLL
jgi:NADH-quinone oxidoreductase subunit N